MSLCHTHEDVTAKSYIDGEVFVGEEEEAFESVVETVELRIGIDEEHTTPDIRTRQVAHRHHSVQDEPVAQWIGAGSDITEKSCVERGLA